jgi:hypothetical protein
MTRISKFTMFFIFTVLVFPLAVLAQEVAGDAGPTWKGIPILPVLSVLATIITGLLGLVGRRISAANAAAERASKAQAAMVRLAAIGFALVGKLWGRLSREFQLRFADGKIDDADRAAFRDIVEEELEAFTSREELQKIAEAAGLPLPGIVAWVAEYAIDRLTKAHDPRASDVSAGTFAVKPGEDDGPAFSDAG